MDSRDAVFVDITGYLDLSSEGPQSLATETAPGPVFQRARNWQVIIGEKDVLPCIEMGIRFMGVGETALIWSHSKFAFGLSQRHHPNKSSTFNSKTSTDSATGSEPMVDVPPNSSVYFILHVHRIVPESELVSNKGQIATARMKKTIGNDIYAHECVENGSSGFQRARQQYRRGADLMLNLLQHPGELDEPSQEQQARQLLLDCLNNISASHLRHGEYKLAKEAAVDVLQHDPDNYKALLRAAKAALMDPGSSFEEVELSIQALQEQQSTTVSRDVVQLQAELKRRKQKYQKRSKEMFRNFFEASVPENNGTESILEDKNYRNTDSSNHENPTDIKVTQCGTKLSDLFQHWGWKHVLLVFALQFLMSGIAFWVSRENLTVNQQDL